MRTIVLRNGLLAGAVMAAAFCLTIPFKDSIGFEWGMVVGYASMVAAFLFVWFGVRAYREEQPDGTVGFGRAFAVGMGIVLVASLLYAVVWDVLYRTVMSDYIATYQAYALEKSRAAGATAAQLAADRADMAAFAERYRNPFFRAALTMMEPLPVGVLIALLAAWAHRRRPAAGRYGSVQVEAA